LHPKGKLFGIIHQSAPRPDICQGAEGCSPYFDASIFIERQHRRGVPIPDVVVIVLSTMQKAHEVRDRLLKLQPDDAVIATRRPDGASVLDQPMNHHRGVLAAGTAAASERPPKLSKVRSPTSVSTTNS
jgi:hypothetical protein